MTCFETTKDFFASLFHVTAQKLGQTNPFTSCFKTMINGVEYGLVLGWLTLASAWNISCVFENQQWVNSHVSIHKIFQNHRWITCTCKYTKIFQVKQILICISVFFWFQRCLTGLDTTMALTTLSHPILGCALKGSQISVSLRSPKITSQSRYDSSILEPNTSSVDSIAALLKSLHLL